MTHSPIEVADGRNKLSGYAEVQDVLALMRTVLNPDVGDEWVMWLFLRKFGVRVCACVCVCMGGGVGVGVGLFQLRG